MSGFLSPEHPESSSLPADEGFGLEDDQRISPTGPNLHEQQPKISVGSTELGPARLPFENHELMAQCQDFEGEIVPTSEERKRIGQNDPENGEHSLVILIENHRQSIIFRPDGLSATHRSLRNS